MEEGTLRQNRSVAGKGTGRSGSLARGAGRRLPPRPTRGRSDPQLLTLGPRVEGGEDSNSPGEGRGRAWPVAGIGSTRSLAEAE